MAYWAAAKASPRWGAAMAMATDAWPISRTPVRWTMATPLTVAKVPKPGAQVQVIGTPTSYDVQPFMIHMDKGAFYGQKPEPATTKKAPARRTPARKRPQ